MQKPSIYYGLFFLFIILCSSCEDIIDCIINRYPVLIEKNLKVGTVDEYYSDFILAEVKNDSDDDSYSYYFSLLGDLPNGIQWSEDDRKLILEGIPTEKGRFYFTVELFVDGRYYDGNSDNMRDPLCDDEASRSYVLIIN